MALVLALDQSTSATKALLLDHTGQCLARASLDHQQHYPQPGWVEHDAEEIWQNALTVLRQVGGARPPSFAQASAGFSGALGPTANPAPNSPTAASEKIACLSIANQRETIVIFSRRTGKPLHRAIVWQCRRGDALCAAQISAGRESAIHQRTGLKVDSYFSASKLQWLIRSRPDLQDQLLSGEALIGTVDAYLIYRLTGGAVFATDQTNASRTLLYDIVRLRWDEELCRWWDVPMAALPEVRDSTAVFGETSLDGFLTRPLPIQGVMGDSQASLFGQGCFAAGEAKVTFGTGTSVLLNIGSTPRFSTQGVVTALAWVRDGRPTYAMEGIIISSAAALAWLRDRLAVIADFGEAETMARGLKDNGGVYLVPAFSGLGLPYWRPEARAAIVGLSGQSDRRHLVRAALESVAYQLADVIAAMATEAGAKLTALRADGGATVNGFLMQFIADIAGLELHVAAATDGSALGAAFAGLWGAGVFPSLEAVRAALRRRQVYAPEMEPAQTELLLAGWSRAVRSVLTGPEEPAVPALS